MTARTPDGGGRSRRLWSSIATISVLAVLLTGPALPGTLAPLAELHGGQRSASAAAAPRGGPALSPGTIEARAAGTLAPPSGLVAGGPPSGSGPGTFYTSTAQPLPAVGSQGCYRTTPTASACTPVNDTTGPVLNVTSDGTVVLAYTAFSNDSTCGAVHRHFTQTMVAVSTSRNGTGWSSPIYLGNPRCDAANATNYTSAWQPTVASLGNGTIVLAYVEYNLTSGFAPNLWASRSCTSATSCSASTNVKSAQLVLTRSYDDGAHWSTPQSINTSFVAAPAKDAAFVPWHPSIAAWGDTVYLAWANFTGYPSTVFGYSGLVASASGGVHLVVSTDGGVSFGAPVRLPTSGVTAYSDYAANPALATLPNGTVELAYVTNLTYGAKSCCDGAYTYDAFHVDVDLATSYANGSSFSVKPIVTGVPMYPGSASPHPFFDYDLDPAPVLAVAPRAHQLYAAFSALDPGEICRASASGAVGCAYTYNLSQVYFANASYLGGGWRTAVVGAVAAAGSETALNGSDVVPSQHFMPSLAVDGSGTIYLQATVLNGTDCGGYTSYGFRYVACGRLTEVLTRSSTNGTTWTSPLDLAEEPTLWAQYMPNGPTTAIALGSSGPIYAWTDTSCPIWNGSAGNYGQCFWGSKPIKSTTTVETSVLFQGTGITLSFRASGLPPGTAWAIDLLGNYRSSSGATLSVSGVPANTWVAWAVGPAKSVYGAQVSFASAPPPPERFSAGRTIYENATARYLLNIASNPPYAQTPGGSSCYFGNVLYWDNAACPFINYNLTPGIESIWEKPNVTVNVSVSPNQPPLWCSVYYCYYYSANLSFLGWSGVGPGSSSTSGNATSIRVLGPINETAEFQFVGWCYTYEYSTTVSRTCVGANASLLFVEHGLPEGTRWGVSTWSSLAPAALPSENFTTSQFLLVNGSSLSGITSYSPWSILPASGASNRSEWTAQGTPGSPVLSWSQSVVSLNYTSGPAPARVPLLLQATGIYANASWAYTVDNGTPYGLASPSGTLEIAPGLHTLAALPIYFANGTGFRATALDEQSFAFPGTWQNRTAVPGTVRVNASALARFAYAPTAELEVRSSEGGSASPATGGWYLLGTKVTLNETPEIGYHFVGWSGTGSGAVTTALTDPTIGIGGPVSEVATFARNASAGFIVTVVPQGLPYDESFSVAFNGSIYSSDSGNLTLPAVSAGDYPLSVPVSYANSSSSERFVPGALATSIPAGPGGTYDITADGTVTVSFTTQYVVSVASSGPGRVSPAPGPYWADASAPFSLTASPSAGYALSGWSGSGPGAVSGSALSVAPRPGGPISETALFVIQPPAGPASYTLSVTETGLPGGTGWSVATGSSGATGAGANLTVAGRNGSYTVTVPVVNAASGVRYVPSASGALTLLETLAGSNVSISVQFTEQFFVWIAGGSGGSVGPVSGWVDAGSTIALSAQASNSAFVFAGWSGQPYTGPRAEVPIDVNGPVNETAAFAPSYRASTTGSATAGMDDGLAILAVLLAAGILVGALLARRPRRPAGTDEADAEGLPPEPGPEGEAATEPTAPFAPWEGDVDPEPGPFDPDPTGPEPFDPILPDPDGYDPSGPGGEV